MTGITWNYLLKFIITGDAGVGKSSLLVRFTNQRFLANSDPTIGVEFGTKEVHIPIPDEEPKVFKLQCWDTAGTESFRSIARSYYRGAAGCLLVYDVTSKQSFQNAKSWLKDVRELADPHLTCILVGNKADLCEDETGGSSSRVPAAEAQQWATDEGLLFLEASAKSGRNVEVAFQQACLDIYRKIQQGKFREDRSPGVKLSKPTNALDQVSNKRACC